jgi:hypothetical protein
MAEEQEGEEISHEENKNIEKPFESFYIIY